MPLAPSTVDAVALNGEEGALSLAHRVRNVPLAVATSVDLVVAVGLGHMGGTDLAAETRALQLENNATRQSLVSVVPDIQGHTSSGGPALTRGGSSVDGEPRPHELVAGLGVNVLASTGGVVVLDGGLGGSVGRA